MARAVDSFDKVKCPRLLRTANGRNAMPERYSETVRQAMLSAYHEAREFGSPSIAPQHMLLGLVAADRSLTHRFLHGIDSVGWYREQVENRAPRQEPTESGEELPFDAASERVLEYAGEEAARMGHNDIHTEHLLLGLLREEQSVAAEILRDRGLQLDAVRGQVERSWRERAHALRLAVMRSPEPRWPAFVAMAADALIHYALPDRLSLGPRWFSFAVVIVLLIPIIFSIRFGRHNMARILTFVAIGTLALSLVGSLALLIEGLPAHKDSPGTLLRSATLLWITNILVFALWYWKLDAGGPLGREKADARSSFVFPQMTQQPDQRDASWSPDFLDYLFLAFNTSTAFSPTDTAVLSPWAKGLMMLQSIISLSIIALLAARAVNVL